MQVNCMYSKYPVKSKAFLITIAKDNVNLITIDINY